MRYETTVKLSAIFYCATAFIHEYSARFRPSVCLFVTRWFRVKMGKPIVDILPSDKRSIRSDCEASVL